MLGFSSKKRWLTFHGYSAMHVQPICNKSKLGQNDATKADLDSLIAILSYRIFRIIPSPIIMFNIGLLGNDCSNPKPR